LGEQQNFFETAGKVTLNFLEFKFSAKIEPKKYKCTDSAMEQKKSFSRKAELDTLLCVVVSVFLTHLHILEKMTFAEGLLQSFRAGRGPVMCM